MKISTYLALVDQANAELVPYLNKGPIATLTPRELAVIRELAKDGSSNPVIARRLGIANSTVKAHMRSILTKLRASNRAHLLILWREP